MRIQVLYFATFRDYTGVKEEEFEIAEGTTISELRGTLADRHARLEAALPSALFSVNREFAFPDRELQEGDEVGVFPPVSGGGESGPTLVGLTEGELDLNRMLERLVLPTSGAACFFSGVVREVTERGAARETVRLEYEAYQSMAEAKMRQVAEEIRERWPAIEGIAIVQRLGQLGPGTPTVAIACTAAHRDTGVFEAARYGIDRLKEIVPVWKKEVGPEGGVWVHGSYQPTETDRAP